MNENVQIPKLSADLKEAWDDEGEARRIAGQLILHGPPGIDALVDILKANSGKSPKMSIGILTAFREHANPYAKQRLLELLDQDLLTEDDSAYLLTSLGGGSRDYAVAKNLIQKLSRTRDRVARSEMLVEVVRLQLSEARDILHTLRVDASKLDYAKEPDSAMREEMIHFALLALDGRHPELEEIILDDRSHPYRRSAALEILSASLGDDAAPLLQRALSLSVREIRVAAVRAAIALRFEEASRIITAGLQDPDDWVCFVALGGLAALLDTEDSTRNLDSLRLFLGILIRMDAGHPSDKTLHVAAERLRKRIVRLTEST